MLSQNLQAITVPRSPCPSKSMPARRQYKSRDDEELFTMMRAQLNRALSGTCTTPGKLPAAHGTPRMPPSTGRSFLKSSDRAARPSYLPLFRQQRLKAPPGAAGAGIVAAEFFGQLFLAVDDPLPALDVRLGWIAPSAFAAALKRSLSARRQKRCPFMVLLRSRCRPARWPCARCAG